MRWLYHALIADEWERARAADVYAAPSLATEGFVHASFRDAVVASARLYLPREAPIVVLQIDPRRLDVPVDVAETPRGGMPHVRGAVPRAAITRVWRLEELEAAIARGEAPDGVGARP